MRSWLESEIAVASTINYTLGAIGGAWLYSFGGRAAVATLVIFGIAWDIVAAKIVAEARRREREGR